MTRQLALGLMVTSPVIRPTSWNSSVNSLNFWLLSALMGEVYTTRSESRSAIAMAYLRHPHRVTYDSELRCRGLETHHIHVAGEHNKSTQTLQQQSFQPMYEPTREPNGASPERERFPLGTHPAGRDTLLRVASQRVHPQRGLCAAVGTAEVAVALHMNGSDTDTGKRHTQATILVQKNRDCRCGFR